MDKAQYEAARKVILNDCEIVGRLMDKEGRTCAVGGLAKAAGVPDSVLTEDGWSSKVYTPIEDTFGIGNYTVAVLMGANDGTAREDLKGRRKAVLRALDGSEEVKKLFRKKFLGIF